MAIKSIIEDIEFVLDEGKGEEAFARIRAQRRGDQKVNPTVSPGKARKPIKAIVTGARIQKPSLFSKVKDFAKSKAASVKSKVQSLRKPESPKEKPLRTPLPRGQAIHKVFKQVKSRLSSKTQPEPEKRSWHTDSRMDKLRADFHARKLADRSQKMSRADRKTQFSKSMSGVPEKIKKRVAPEYKSQKELKGKVADRERGKPFKIDLRKKGKEAPTKPEKKKNVPFKVDFRKNKAEKAEKAKPSKKYLKSSKYAGFKNRITDRYQSPKSDKKKVGTFRPHGNYSRRKQGLGK